MNITALKTFRIALDGIGYRVATIQEGESIDAEQGIAEGLIAEGYAIPAIEEKKIVAAPENKMVPSAPANKTATKRGAKK